MKTTILRRIILLALLPIPIVMLVASFKQMPPDQGLELAFLMISIPILVLNVWEWTLSNKGD